MIAHPQRVKPRQQVIGKGIFHPRLGDPAVAADSEEGEVGVLPQPGPLGQGDGLVADDAGPAVPVPQFPAGAVVDEVA